MKKTTNTAEEKTTSKASLLQPFPFNEDERYLLKLADGRYVVAYWSLYEFASDYDDNSIEDEIESIVSLKELGLWRTKKNIIYHTYT